MSRLFSALLALTLMVSCGPPESGSEGTPLSSGQTGPEGASASEPAPELTDSSKAVLVAGLDLSGREGNLRLFLTDEPAEYDAVWVTVSRTEVQVGEGSEQQWVTLVETPAEYDLLQLRNDVTAVMGDATLAPGHYGQLRMIVSEAAVEKDGVRTELFIPSGAQTGIKINLALTVEPDTQYVLVTDFDAARSIKKTGRGLLMEPVLAVELLGTVDAEGRVALISGGEAAEGEVDAGTEAPSAPEQGAADAGVSVP